MLVGLTDDSVLIHPAEANLSLTDLAARDCVQAAYMNPEDSLVDSSLRSQALNKGGCAVVTNDLTSVRVGRAETNCQR